MKRSLVVMFSIFSLNSHSIENETLSNYAEMIHKACGNEMVEMINKYGKSFLCVTTNSSANSMNSSFITDDLEGEGRINMPIRFSGLHYEVPGDKFSALNYSYNISDMNAVESLLISGLGLTLDQQGHKVCRESLRDFQDKSKNLDKDYVDKKTTSKDYELWHRVYIDAISNINKFCPN